MHTLAVAGSGARANLSRKSRLVMWSGSLLMKHWRRAAPTTGMTHIAILEQLDGKTGNWLEKVTDQQYRK